jgi:hypothetical protein
MMSEYSIDDFIGVFPNAIPEEDCNRIIKFYDDLDKNRNPALRNRKKDEGAVKIEKDNDFVFLHPDDHAHDEIQAKLSNDIFNNFMYIFWDCYKLYAEKYGILESLAPHQLYYDVKIQKTDPAGGYHVWHCEHGRRENGSRLLLVIGYLNDVEEGGETEFLYQSRRIPAEKGTIMICPAGYTHTHRGNPPLTGSKYIINGWVQFTE